MKYPESYAEACVLLVTVCVFVWLCARIRRLKILPAIGMGVIALGTAAIAAHNLWNYESNAVEDRLKQSMGNAPLGLFVEGEQFASSGAFFASEKFRALVDSTQRSSGRRATLSNVLMAFVLMILLLRHKTWAIRGKIQS